MVVDIARLLVLAIFLGAPVLGVLDVLSHNRREWPTTGATAWKWIIIQLSLLLVGTTLYFFTMHREIESAAVSA